MRGAPAVRRALVLALRAGAAVALLAGGLAGGLTGCKGSTPTLQGAVDDVSASIREMLGAQSLPAKYVQAIYAVHTDDRSWRFRSDVDKPLEKCCDAIRNLSTADYGSWRESSVVTSLLASMSDEHPSALVRAEALDCLARMAPWTTAAVPPTERRATEDEAGAATAQILAARKLPPDDPNVSADLAGALNTIAAFRFDQAEPLPAKVDARTLARESRVQLVTARKVLRALTGGVLDGYDADPRVREALDRALVATSASTIRMALVSAATGAKDEIVREAAVRDLETARPDQAARFLGVVLAQDDSSSVRREAARALGSFPETEAVRELLPGLADDRADVRATAAASLGTVTGQAFGDDRVAWVRWWASRAQGAASPPGATGPAPATDGGRTPQ